MGDFLMDYAQVFTYRCLGCGMVERTINDGRRELGYINRWKDVKRALKPPGWIEVDGGREYFCSRQCQDRMFYRDEITKAMTMLAQEPRTLFIGQNTVYGGAVDIPPTLAGVPAERKIEFPVAEDLQMGVCIGLALTGWLPVCIYPRMDFLLLAFNQLVNHLDKFPGMFIYHYWPKVIIRVGVGASYPLDPGPQHKQDYSVPLGQMLTEVDIRLLQKAEDIRPHYQEALVSMRSSLLVEYQAKMR